MSQSGYRIERLTGSIASLAVLAMMVLTVLDVLGKYILNKPVPGVAEIIASYLMIAAVFLSLGETEARGESITVDVLYTRSGPGWKILFSIAGLLLTLGFYGVLAWQNLGAAISSYEIREFVSGAWDVTVWPSKFLMPIGLAIAMLVLIRKLRNLITSPSKYLMEENAANDKP